jgi:hypothetical protein
VASKTVIYGPADGIQFETLLFQIEERHHNANTVKMSQGAGGCHEQQNDGKTFQPRLHSHPFLVLGVFGNQVEPVQIALT